MGQSRLMNLVADGKPRPAPILPKNLQRIKILDLDPLEIARQLTLMEAKHFNIIRPQELLNKSWSNPNLPAPNIRGNK